MEGLFEDNRTTEEKQRDEDRELRFHAAGFAIDLYKCGGASGNFVDTAATIYAFLKGDK